MGDLREGWRVGTLKVRSGLVCVLPVWCIIDVFTYFIKGRQIIRWCRAYQHFLVIGSSISNSKSHAAALKRRHK